MSNPCLNVLKAGPYMSVQDEGRPGYLRHGVSKGGAMDPRAMEEGRLLVGNERGLAAIEMFGLGGRFEVRDQAVCMVLTGAVFAARIDGEEIKPNTSFLLRQGQILDIGAAKQGNYAYLSVAGGIDTPLVLGSRSTHVKAGFGGFEGRCLRPGDALPLGQGSGQICGAALPLTDRKAFKEVRILWGAQADLFSKEALHSFTQATFTPTHELDRMGARLASSSPPTKTKNGLVAISGPIAPGDIQVPGNGRPIVLLADRQPTGGYPRIATIIAADLAEFAQLAAGSRIQFTPVNEDQAVEALRELHERLDKLPDQLVRAPKDPYESHRLLSQNLISGVVSTNDQPKESKK